MESQDAHANEELLLELTSKNTTRSIKDFSPEGIRLESNLEGEAKGVYNATFYATITMLLKPDRTIDYEVRQIHTTSDGDTVLVYYKGKSIIESPTHNKFVGETTFQTSSKKLAWLNGMKARHEGEYNPVAGENDFRVYGKRELISQGAAATSRPAHQRQLPARVRSGERGHGVPRVLQGKGAGQRHRPRAAPRSAPGPGRNWALAGLPTPIATNPSLRRALNATLVTNPRRPSGSNDA